MVFDGHNFDKTRSKGLIKIHWFTKEDVLNDILFFGINYPAFLQQINFKIVPLTLVLIQILTDHGFK